MSAYNDTYLRIYENIVANSLTKEDVINRLNLLAIFETFLFMYSKTTKEDLQPIDQLPEQTKLYYWNLTAPHRNFYNTWTLEKRFNNDQKLYRVALAKCLYVIDCLYK